MFAVPRKDFPEHKKKTLTAEEMRERGRIAREAAANGNSAPTPKQEDSEADLIDDEEVLLGFARLYSGTIKIGSRICALLPKYDTSVPPSHPRNAKFLHVATVDALYTMMGRELVPVNEVKAGNVFAIAGLEGKVWRSATLCSPGAAGFKEDVKPENLDEQTAGCLINLGSLNMQVRAHQMSEERMTDKAFKVCSHRSCGIRTGRTRYVAEQGSVPRY